MMKRQIFLWMGLFVLFTIFGLSQEIFGAEYKVRRGDTLAKIAAKHGVTTQALKEANGLTGSALKPKQVLVIPDGGKRHAVKSKKTSSQNGPSYIVKKGDTLQTIAKKTGYSVSHIRKLNNVNARSLKVGQKIVLARRGPVKEIAVARTHELDEYDDDDLLEDDEDVVLNDSIQDAEIKTDSNNELLGKWDSPNERSLFVRVAKGFLGAPYRLGGSSVRGLDCSAFVRKIYEFFDVSLPRTAKEQARVGMHVTRDELKEGDLVFFNTRRRAYGHVGIYIGNNEFVHAAAGRARMVRIDTLDKPYYNKRFVKAVRIKGLDSGV